MDKIKNKRKGFELVDIFFKLQIFDDTLGADADGVATLFIDDLIIRLFFSNLSRKSVFKNDNSIQAFQFFTYSIRDFVRRPGDWQTAADARIQELRTTPVNFDVQDCDGCSIK